jgi:signal transduction histidine kinase/CheY-like chemotaxis protein
VSVRERGRSADILRWVVAVVAGAAAMALRGLFDHVIVDDALPYLFGYPAVALVGLLIGSGAALATMTTATLWVLMPGLAPAASASWIQTLVFVPMSTVIAVAAARYADRRGVTAPMVDSLADGATARTLRLTIWVALLLPALLFAIAAAFSYDRAFSSASERAVRSVRAVQEYVQRAIEINESALARTLEVAGDLSPAEIRKRERAIHDRFVWITGSSSQIQHVALWSETGQVLVHSREYPAAPEASVADQTSFEWLRNHPHETFIGWPDKTPKLPDAYALALGRARVLSDGRFAGIATATIYPESLTDFYSTLAVPAEGVGFSLLRDDGRVLARWPSPSGPSSRIDDSSELFAPMAASSASGVLTLEATPSRGRQLVAFQKVGDYPLYATCSVEHSNILAGWYRDVGVLAAFTFPTSFGLMAVAWIALIRTRREISAVQKLKAEAEHRVQVESALRDVQKLEALGRMTGGVAHDVNNLLMVISNSLHILKRLKPELEGQPQVDAIERSVTAGGQLTRRLLAFSRRQPLSLQVLDLAERKDSLLQLVRATTGSRVSVQFCIDEGTAPIRADPSELELAFINLAVNARDAMSEGGRIQIRVRNATPGECADVDTAMVMVAFSDSGHGISAEHLGRVFEPFYTTKAVGKGTGLGLSQIYGLCVQSGGTATVESAEGAGTTVRMYFPSTEGRPAQADREHRIPALRGLRVLLVEDNHAVAQATIPLLESLECRVEHVGNAEEAESVLATRAGDFDAMLSDIVMPGRLNGLGLAGRAITEYPGLGVVLMTGHADEVQQASRLPVAVLHKPVAPEVLARALTDAISGIGPPPEVQAMGSSA